MTTTRPASDNQPDQPSDQGAPPAPPAGGKGMPARSPDPQAQRAPPGEHESARDRSLENTLELPRDRDEAVDMTSGQTSPQIAQAARDIKNGLKDTSKQPEMNQTYQKQKQR